MIAREPLAYWLSLWLVVSVKCAVVYAIGGAIATLFLKHRPAGRAMLWLLVVWSFLWLTVLEAAGRTAMSAISAPAAVAGLPEPILAVVGHLYVIVALFLFGLMMHSAVRLRLLRSYAAPLDISSALTRADPARRPSSAGGIRATPCGVKLTQQVGLYSSAQIAVPTSFGVLEPAILIPTSLPGTTYHRLVRTAIVHEFVAVLRFDALWMVLVRLVQCLHFLHPAAWLASRQYCRAREQVCDRWTVRTTGDAAEYESCLLALARQPRRASAFMGLDTPMSRGDQAAIHDRIRRLQYDDRPRSLSLRPAAVVVVAWMIMLAVLAGAGWQTEGPAAGLTWQSRPMLMGMMAAAVAGVGMGTVMVIGRGRRARLIPPVDGLAGQSRQTVSQCVQWIAYEWQEAQLTLSATARRFEPLLIVGVMLAVTIMLWGATALRDSGERGVADVISEARQYDPRSR